MSNSKKPEFKLNLLENGLDFLLKGIDELFDDSYFLTDHQSATDVAGQSYKYGTLHIFAGFLLILKERLARHFPELIYKGRLAEVRSRLEAGKTLKTVDFDEILERLEIGPKFVFSETDLGIIRQTQDLRNALEHSEVTLNKHEVWKILSKFLKIVDRFLVDELDVRIESSVIGDELSNKIRKIETVWRRVEVDLRKEEYRRLRDVLERFKTVRDEYMEDLAFQARDSGDMRPDILYCSECDEESLFAFGEFAGICHKCESVSPVSDCLRCTEPVRGFEWDQNLCDACISYIAAE